MIWKTSRNSWNHETHPITNITECITVKSSLWYCNFRHHHRLSVKKFKYIYTRTKKDISKRKPFVAVHNHLSSIKNGPTIPLPSVKRERERGEKTKKLQKHWGPIKWPFLNRGAFNNLDNLLLLKPNKTPQIYFNTMLPLSVFVGPFSVVSYYLLAIRCQNEKVGHFSFFIFHLKKKIKLTKSSLWPSFG